jgi:hypothetical protein
MKRSTKTLLWVGGAVVGAIAVVAVAKAAKPAAAVVVPPGGALPGAAPGAGTEINSLTPATTLTSNVLYEIMSTVQPGIPDAATLSSLLVSGGWTNIQIIYWGPTKSGIYPTNFPGASSAPSATTYVASAVWSGSNGAAIPAGLLVANVATPYNLSPGAMSLSIPSGGMLNLYLPPGATWSSLVDTSSPTTPLGGVVQGASGPATVQFNSTGGILGLFQTNTGTMTASWVDSTGHAQQTTLSWTTT